MSTPPTKIAYIIQANNKTWISGATLVMGGKALHAIKPRAIGHVDNHRSATRFKSRDVADYVCDALNVIRAGHTVRILPNPGSSGRLTPPYPHKTI